jgi:hypothetical protein
MRKEIKGGPDMPDVMEQRLERLGHELNEIRKEMILQKIRQTAVSAGKINSWKALGSKVSARWNHVSAVEEIRLQRDRS